LANQKISQLTDGSPAQAADQYPINRAGSNFRINTSTVLTGAVASSLALAGATSGTVSFTAPAVAGTVTNPIAISNVISLPAGAAATNSVQLAGTPGLGFDFDGTQGMVFNIAGAPVAEISNVTGLTLNVGDWFGWGAIPGGTNDTTIARPAAKVIQFGASGDDTALIRDGNIKRLTTDTALATSATNVFQWSLPASAKPWAFRADIIWSVTAGTTPTLSIGVNASQTPTGTTNAAASILTTNADVGTEGTAAISASGAINVLTTGTLTPSGTLFQAQIFGTLLASGTAGTFSITMTGTGAGFAGTASAGSFATIW